MTTRKDENRYSHAVIKNAVRQLNELYRDEKKRRELGEKAFTEWKKRFSWEVIAKQYEQLYLKLIQEK